MSGYLALPAKILPGWLLSLVGKTLCTGNIFTTSHPTAKLLRRPIIEKFPSIIMSFANIKVRYAKLF